MSNKTKLGVMYL